MTLTDPKYLLEKINMERFAEYIGKDKNLFSKATFNYVEPARQTSPSDDGIHIAEPIAKQNRLFKFSKPSQVIEGKVQKLGDFVDTDAVKSHRSLRLVSEVIC